VLSRTYSFFFSFFSNLTLSVITQEARHKYEHIFDHTMASYNNCLTFLKIDQIELHVQQFKLIKPQQNQRT
jgi:hypothetical protein